LKTWHFTIVFLHLLQYGDRADAPLLQFCNNWHGNICIIHTTAEELLQVSGIFVGFCQFCILLFVKF